MKLEKSLTKKFRSSRVKTLEVHPSKNIVACGLYNGYVQVWDTLSLRLVNETQVSEYPIRTIRVVEKNDCLLIGTDEGKIHIYDLNSLRRLQSFEAHADFIRKIEVHPSQEEFLTCSDDGTIKRWRLGKDIKNLATYSGHGHFVMDVKFYPKDTRRFISCSLDGTVKMWDVSQGKAFKTYKGHINGINSLCFTPDGEYFVSASDDLSLKVWEMNSTNCLSTLTGHTDNINSLYAFTNKIVSTSEDGTVRMWDSKTFQLKDTLSFNSGRVWECRAKGSVFVVGTDENLIFVEFKTGTTLATLRNRNVVYALQNKIYSCRVEESLHSVKMLCELDYFPSQLAVSASGKSIALVHENSFSLFSSLGFRKKVSSSGSSLCFTSNSEFVVLNGDSLDFYEKNEVVKRLKMEGVSQAFCLGEKIVGVFEESTTFYNLQGKSLWSVDFPLRGVEESGEFFIGIKDSSLVIFKESGIVKEFNFKVKEIVRSDKCGDEGRDKGIDKGIDGIDKADGSKDDSKPSSYSLSPFFVFSSDGKFYYLLVGDTPYVHPLLSSQGVLAGVEGGTVYYLEDEKVKTLPLDLEFINFQIQILKDPSSSPVVGDTFKAISFFESLGLHDRALEICTNENHKFEILLRLNRLEEAFRVADTPLKFERLGTLFVKSNLQRASDCFYRAKDYRSLLFSDLLSRKKYLKEIASNCRKEGYPNYSLIASLKAKNYEGCGTLLKDTPFFPLFSKTFLK